MSRSRTATLQPSPIWNARSQTVAGSSTAISSASGQTSIGGPSQPPRANQPEMVSHEGLCPSGHAGDLGPGLEGLGSGCSILAGGAVIAAEVEEVADLVVGGEEALSLAGRLEALHLPLPSSGRLMRILRPVIEMLWGGGDGMARSPPEATDGAPHATAE